MTSKRCPYTIIGVQPSSAPFLIEAAYGAMIKRYQSDAGTDLDAERRTRELVEAFAIVGNVERRAEYDAARALEKARSGKQLRSRPADGAGKARTGSPSSPLQPPLVQSPVNREPDGAGRGWNLILAMIVVFGIAMLIGLNLRSAIGLD